jgi:hypothetical protein
MRQIGGGMSRPFEGEQVWPGTSEEKAQNAASTVSARTSKTAHE